jgi:hypothetical protein
MNIPIIGETNEQKALRELDERIDRLPLERRQRIGLAIELVNQALDQVPPEDRVFAILYHSRALAVRFRDAKDAEAAAQDKPH